MAAFLLLRPASGRLSCLTTASPLLRSFGVQRSALRSFSAISTTTPPLSRVAGLQLVAVDTVFRPPSLLKFTPSWVQRVRNTYYGSGRGPSSGGFSGGPRGNGGGFFTSFKRRIDSMDGMKLFYTIVGLNGGVFALWWYASESYKNFRDPSLLIWMVNNFTTSARNLFQGRFWTLITSCFSQQDVGHLFFNLLGLWFMARPAISMLGNASFLALYLGGGLLSSSISVFWNVYNGRNGASHGASGAIAAIMAFYATMFPRATFYLYMIVPVPAWLCVGGLAGYDLYQAITNPARRTDGAGHLGGFAAGCMYALRFRRRLI